MISDSTINAWGKSQFDDWDTSPVESRRSIFNNYVKQWGASKFDDWDTADENDRADVFVNYNKQQKPQSPQQETQYPAVNLRDEIMMPHKPVESTRVSDEIMTPREFTDNPKVQTGLTSQLFEGAKNVAGDLASFAIHPVDEYVSDYFVPEKAREWLTGRSKEERRGSSTNIAGGILEDASLGIIRPENFMDNYDPESRAAKVGGLIGMTVPYGGAYKTAKGLYKGARYIPEMLNPMIRGGLVGTATGATREIGDLIHGEEFDVGNIADEAVLFAAFDGTLSALGQVGKGISNLIRNGQYKRAKIAYDAVRGDVSGSSREELDELFNVLNKSKQPFVMKPAKESAKVFEEELALSARLNKGFHDSEKIKSGASTIPNEFEKPYPRSILPKGYTHKPAKNSVEALEKELALSDQANKGFYDLEKIKSGIQEPNLTEKQTRMLDAILPHHTSSFPTPPVSDVINISPKIKFKKPKATGKVSGLRKGEQLDKTTGEITKIKTEKTSAGEQITFAPQRQVPTNKIRKVGKKSKVAKEQGDVFSPEKIKKGNMAQDQTTFVEKLKSPEKIFKETIRIKKKARTLAKDAFDSRGRISYKDENGVAFTLTKSPSRGMKYRVSQLDENLKPVSHKDYSDFTTAVYESNVYKSFTKSAKDDISKLGKKGVQDRKKFNVNLNNKQTLKEMRADFKDSGLKMPGPSIYKDYGHKNQEYIYTKYVSSTPEYWKNKGYQPKEMVKILDKAIAGEKLTIGQRRKIREAHYDFARFREGALRDMTSPVSRFNLKVGDEFKQLNKWYRVVDKKGDKLILNDDGVLSPTDKIHIDRVRAEGKYLIRRNVSPKETIIKNESPSLWADMPFSVAGGAYGFEQDKQGNVTFDPTKAVAGMALGVFGARMIGKNSKNVLKDIAGGIKKRASSVTRFLHQSKNRIKDATGKKLIDEIRQTDNAWHQSLGKYMERLRDTNVRKRLFRKNMSGEELSTRIENGEEPIINKLLDDVHKAAKDVGIQLGYIGDKGHRYLSRLLKEDVAIKLRDDLSGLSEMIKEHGNISDIKVLKNIGKTTKDIVKHIQKKHPDLSLSQIIGILEKKASGQLFGDLSFLKKRTLDLPAWVYERDARKILPVYLNGVTKRIEQVRTWGVDFEKANKRILDVASRDLEEGKNLQTILDMWSGQYDIKHGFSGKTRKAIEGATALEFISKISLGKATIPNTTQTFISTFVEFGMVNTTKGLVKLFSESGRKFVRESGALLSSALDAVMGTRGSGTINHVSQVMSKASGFTGINKFNLALAASTAEVGIKDLMKIAKKGNGVRSRWAKKRLADFGINPNEVLTDKKLGEQMYRFATDAQLQRNVLNDPLIINSRWGKPLALFKRFGYRQAVKQKEIITREIKRGNVMPILRLAAGGYLGGEFVIAAKNEIKSILSGEEQYRKSKPFSWERAAENLAAVGSFGVVSDMVDIEGMISYIKDAIAGTPSKDSEETMKDLGNSINFAVTPVMIADIIQIGGTFIDILGDAGKYGDFGFAVQKNLKKIARPLGSLISDISTRGLTESHKIDRAEYYKGDERRKILDLYVTGDNVEAKRRKDNWNKHHPKDKIFISHDDVEQAKNKAKRWNDKVKTLTGNK